MDIEILASDLQFPEGPVLMVDGSLLVVEIARGTLTRIYQGRTEIVAKLDGGPNGAAPGPDGKIYICNNGGRFQFVERDGLQFPGPRPDTHKGGWIERVDPASGRSEKLYDACDGRRLNAPNDLVFDRHGGFWFTDHGTGNQDGGLFHAKADGSEIRRWKDERTSPNGVGLSPDERTVYFADTRERRLFAFRIESPGVLVTQPAEETGLVLEVAEGQLFDSLAVEADGRVCVATLINGGITVCSPGGTWEHIAVPDPMTTNLCFGGEDMRDAYITLSASGRVAKTRWPRPGLSLNYRA